MIKDFIWSTLLTLTCRFTLGDRSRNLKQQIAVDHSDGKLITSARFNKLLEEEYMMDEVLKKIRFC